MFAVATAFSSRPCCFFYSIYSGDNGVLELVPNSDNTYFDRVSKEVAYIIITNLTVVTVLTPLTKRVIVFLTLSQRC